MCGRYYRWGDQQKIPGFFEARNDVEGIHLPEWDLDIAPYTKQLVTIQNGNSNDGEPAPMLCGLVPFSNKNIACRRRFLSIDARVESIANSSTYRQPFKRRRYLIPTSEFYEWKRLSTGIKQPGALSSRTEASSRLRDHGIMERS